MNNQVDFTRSTTYLNLIAAEMTQEMCHKGIDNVEGQQHQSAYLGSTATDLFNDCSSDAHKDSYYEAHNSGRNDQMNSDSLEYPLSSGWFSQNNEYLDAHNFESEIMSDRSIGGTSKISWHNSSSYGSPMQCGAESLDYDCHNNEERRDMAQA